MEDKMVAGAFGVLQIMGETAPLTVMIVSSWYSNFFVSENGILAHGASIGYSSPLTLSDQVSKTTYFLFV